LLASLTSRIRVVDDVKYLTMLKVREFTLGGADVIRTAVNST
jgi:hypothetical protein